VRCAAEGSEHLQLTAPRQPRRPRVGQHGVDGEADAAITTVGRFATVEEAQIATDDVWASR
jgi:hypothetical protein